MTASVLRALNAAKRLSFAVFLVLERVGIHLLPAQYYTPVANRRWLRRHPDAWRAPLSLPGFDMDLDTQLEWLRETCSPYYAEVEGLARYTELAGSGIGQGYGPIEAQVLHCVIRSRQPALVVEIGSGISTAVMVDAGERNAADGRTKPRIVSVDPFPRAQHSGVELVAEFAQLVPQSVFDELATGDVLFVDSTHVVKTGSEVIRLCLEVVPRLPPGVLVHFHDVFLPYAYPRIVLSSYFDWQESALVAALLTGNSRLAVRCCESALHYGRPEQFGRILRDYRPQPNDDGLRPGGPLSDGPPGHFPSSLWLETR